MMITLSLTVALAFVVLMRRSLTSRATRWSARFARRTKSSARLTGTTETGEAPRRMRPRLALSVSGVPSHDAVRSAQNTAATDEAIGVADVLSASAPPDARAEREFKHAVAGTHEGDPAVHSSKGPVDAPGWPSPGELAAVPVLDEFDSSSPGGRVAQAGAPQYVDAVADDAQALDITPGWAGDDAHGDSTTTLSPLVDWDQAFATQSAGGSVATLSLSSATGDTVWEKVDEYPQDSTGGAQQQWNTTAWAWETSDALGAPTDWAEPETDDEPTEKQDGPVDPVSSQTPRVHVVEVPAWTETADPAVASPWYPQTDHERVMAAARPFMASAGTAGTSAPIVVVVIPEPRATPTDREDALVRAVLSLEKRLAALTDSTLRPAEQRKQSPRTKRPPAAPTTVFTLTKVEAHALRALASRRSTPTATRRRARIVLATARGLNVAAIATRVGVHRTTVRRWQVRFAAKRLGALNDPRPRRVSER